MADGRPSLGDMGYFLQDLADRARAAGKGGLISVDAELVDLCAASLKTLSQHGAAEFVREKIKKERAGK